MHAAFSLESLTLYYRAQIRPHLVVEHSMQTNTENESGLVISWNRQHQYYSDHQKGLHAHSYIVKLHKVKHFPGKAVLISILNDWLFPTSLLIV